MPHCAAHHLSWQVRQLLAHHVTATIVGYSQHRTQPRQEACRPPSSAPGTLPPSLNPTSRKFRTRFTHTYPRPTNPALFFPSTSAHEGTSPVATMMAQGLQVRGSNPRGACRDGGRFVDGAERATCGTSRGRRASAAVERLKDRSRRPMRHRHWSPHAVPIGGSPHQLRGTRRGTQSLECCG
jgi:hypothetical protein